jgi:hypothetical protein
MLALATSCDSVAGLNEFHPATKGGGGSLGSGGAPVGGAPGGSDSGGSPPMGGDGGAGGNASGCASNLLIAEVRTYGEGAGDDDFVEIHNPTAEDISLDDVSIWAYKPDSAPATPRWSGERPQHVPAGGRFVVGGKGFDPRLRDSQLDQSIGDSQIVLLRRGPGGTPPTIDHVCICTNDCGQQALWGGCPGVLPNPAWVGGTITLIADSLARIPDCIDTDTDVDFDNGPPTPGEANE